MQVINNELKRGGNITDQIMTGKAQWKELFTKHTFFTAGYKYYLAVTTASTTSEAHLPWSGFVESRVRLLVRELERHESIALAHPFNKGYARVHRCRNEEEVEKAKGGSLEYQAKDIATATTGHGLAVGPSSTADLVNGEQKMDNDVNVTMVYTTTHYIGLELHEGELFAFPQPRILNCYTLTRKPTSEPARVFVCRPSANSSRGQIS
jgi:poly(A) polymerase